MFISPLNFYLIRTIENDNIFCQRFSHVLHSLGFSGSGGPSRTSAHAHAQSLGQSDVATIGKWRDDQTLLATEVLVLVEEVDVRDRDHRFLDVLKYYLGKK